MRRHYNIRLARIAHCCVHFPTDIPDGWNVVTQSVHLPTGTTDRRVVVVEIISVDDFVADTVVILVVTRRQSESNQSRQDQNLYFIRQNFFKECLYNLLKVKTY